MISKDQALEEIKELTDPVDDEELRQQIIDYVHALYEQLEPANQAEPINQEQVLINIIVVKDNFVDENILTNDPKQAEAIFLAKCREYINNFDKEYAAEDIKGIFDDGYIKFCMDNSISITWPEQQFTK